MLRDAMADHRIQNRALFEQTLPKRCQESGSREAEDCYPASDPEKGVTMATSKRYFEYVLEQLTELIEAMSPELPAPKKRSK